MSLYIFLAMRYHYKQEYGPAKHGQIYRCDHPLYSVCTLYERDGRGLAVVQTAFDDVKKSLYFTRISTSLADDIYRNQHFEEYFLCHAREPVNGLYPTVNVRSIMWALRMWPLDKDKNIVDMIELT